MSSGTIILCSMLALSIASSGYFLFTKRSSRFFEELRQCLLRVLAGRPDLAALYAPKTAQAGQAEIQSYLNKLVSKVGANFKKNFSVGYHLTKNSESMKDVANRLQDMSDKPSSQADQVSAGGEPVVDIAAPIVVTGRHWGCLRIGYLHDMVK